MTWIERGSIMRETFIRSKFHSLDEKRFRFDTSYITRVVTSKTIKVDVYKDAARADLSNRERERGFRMTSECRHCWRTIFFEKENWLHWGSWRREGSTIKCGEDGLEARPRLFTRPRNFKRILLVAIFLRKRGSERCSVERNDETIDGNKWYTKFQKIMLQQIRNWQKLDAWNVHRFSF